MLSRLQHWEAVLVEHNLAIAREIGVQNYGALVTSVRKALNWNNGSSGLREVERSLHGHLSPWRCSKNV